MVPWWSCVLAAAAAAPVGVGMWQWLRGGRYRVEGDDEPRRSLARVWWVVPASVLAGGLAGTLGWPAVLLAWVYLMGAVAVAWIDLDVHRVPDRVLLVWGPLVLAAAAMTAAVGGSWAQLLRAGLVAVVLGGGYLLCALVGSMGLGDVKLAAVTGVLLGWVGWPAVIVGTLAAFGLAAAVAIALLVRGADRTAHLAFGPAIIAGAAAAVLHAGLS